MGTQPRTCSAPGRHTRRHSPASNSDPRPLTTSSPILTVSSVACRAAKSAVTESIVTSACGSGSGAIVRAGTWALLGCHSVAGVPSASCKLGTAELAALETKCLDGNTTASMGYWLPGFPPLVSTIHRSAFWRVNPW